MKKILFAITALCALLCVVGCTGKTEPPTTTTKVTSASTTSTTFVKNNSDENKAAEAKIGFDAFVGYLNMCAQYGVPVEVNDNDTIKAIVDRMTADGSYIETLNINHNARFFDYAMENPSYAEGGSLYVLREDADWLSLYVE